MTWKSHEAASFENWGSNNGHTLDQLKFGLMVRMTKALEAMSRNYVGLLGEVKDLRMSRENAWASERRLQHRVRGLRGALTRAKKKTKKEE